MSRRNKRTKKLEIIKEQFIGKKEPKQEMITVPGLVPVPKLKHKLKPDYDLLVSLLNYRTHSYSKEQDLFISMLQDRFNLKGATTSKDKYGNLYVTKGKADFYPCVVGHTDINQSKVGNPIVNQNYPWIFGFDASEGEQCGIGADDKVGVYFALHMFEVFENIKLFFPKDEEVGLVGTNSADESFFADCSMLVQLDRNSYKNDLINYTNGIEVCSDEFLKEADSILKKYNYTTNRGSCTDIGGIKKFSTVNCVAMNVSCGYVNEHSSQEVISMPHFENAINFGYELLKLGVSQVWPHTSPKESYSWGNSRNYSSSYYSRSSYYEPLWDPKDDVFTETKTDLTFSVEGPVGLVKIPNEFKEQDFFLAESYPDLMIPAVRAISLEQYDSQSQYQEVEFTQQEIDESLTDGFCPSCFDTIEVDNRLLVYCECETCESRWNVITDNYYEHGAS